MSYMNAYRGPQSPQHEGNFPTFSNSILSPARNPNRVSTGNMTSQDARAGLHRRFTTNALPTLTPIGQQRRQAAGDYTSNSAYNRLPPSERAADRYERLLAEQRRLQEQIDSIDPQARREVDEGRRHELAVSQMMAQSEPTTPPEYSDAFPTPLSRPNRYSAQSLTSPPGIASRPNRSSAQMTSPPGLYRGYTTGSNNLPSQSVPGSRRHSDDEGEEDDFMYDFDIHRAAANPNRNSMPITGYDRKRNTLGDVPSTLAPINSTSFLFLDDGKPSKRSSQTITTSPPNGKTFLHLQQTADGFPKLIRREDTGEVSLSDSSAALDLALSQAPETNALVKERSTAGRNRVSLPAGVYSNSNSTGIAGLNSILANANDSKLPATNRRSMEVKFAAETKRPGLTPPRATNGIPKTQSSYSTNDIPTLKSIKNDITTSVAAKSPSSKPTHLSNTTSPQQNAAPLARLPSGSAVNMKQQNNDFASTTAQQDQGHGFAGPQPHLQANAQAFGPPPGSDNQFQSFTSPTMSPYAQPAYYGGYGMQMLNAGFNNMNLGGNFAAQGQPQAQWPGQAAPFQGGGYGGYNQFSNGNQAVAGAGRVPDTQRGAATQRRQQNEEANARFASITVKDLIGEIYGLCKDQHGCRFLQRKLEERNPEATELIFNEVKDHIMELMTDPFGNYLCQKLLESTTDAQRSVLIHNAMPAMTKIALNQHGTRALQKMIEHITTPEQTQMIIEALRYDVVQLIQDLNGNHVIQKCLNHLSSKDAQFIFDAVGANCVTVGTHRHGCCVLQRCIDHASGHQKGDLIRQITANSFALVQDPFGNYVVQYILDLAEPAFTEPLCAGFVGNVNYLSKQKFSSNVMEKCIRCAQDETRRALIREMTSQQELEKLLRDSYANYVVQTAMDFADEDSKAKLVQCIRPILPSIRNTPYGRRIQTKVTDYDASRPNSGLTSGVMTPLESTASPNSQMSYQNQNTPSNRVNRMGFIGSPPNWTGPASFAGGMPGSGPIAGVPGMNFASPTSWTPHSGGSGGIQANNIASPTPQRNSQTYAVLNGVANNTNGEHFQPPSFGGGAYNGMSSGMHNGMSNGIMNNSMNNGVNNGVNNGMSHGMNNGANTSMNNGASNGTHVRNTTLGTSDYDGY